MDDSLLRAALDRETRALVAVGAPADPVPTCPGWTVADVVRHVGQVQRRAAARLTGAAPTDGPAPPDDGAELGRWVIDGLAAVLAALPADLDEERPTFVGPRPARWTLRRLAHETAIHRWDAQAAVGPPAPIDPDLAVDGIDELLTVLAPLRLDPAAFGAERVTLHVHATDVDGEWIVELGAPGYAVRHGHEHGDVAARGPASDLLLLLWSRLPAARVQVFGDAGLLDRWHDAVTI